MDNRVGGNTGRNMAYTQDKRRARRHSKLVRSRMLDSKELDSKELDSNPLLIKLNYHLLKF